MRDRLSMGMPFPYTVPYTFCTVAMLVLFARMLKKLFGHGSRVDTHGLTPVALAKEVCIYLEGCMPSNSL